MAILKFGVRCLWSKTGSKYFFPGDDATRCHISRKIKLDRMFKDSHKNMNLFGTIVVEVFKQYCWLFLQGLHNDITGRIMEKPLKGLIPNPQQKGNSRWINGLTCRKKNEEAYTQITLVKYCCNWEKGIEDSIRLPLLGKREKPQPVGERASKP